VAHGVAAGDGYASRSAVAGRRTSLCASCDPHGPRARRGSHAACWSHEHATTCARRSWRAAVASAVPGGRAAAVRAVLRQRGRSRAPRVRAGRPIARKAGGPIRRQARHLHERACLRDPRAAVPSAPAFVAHGVAAGDGYASRSAVAGRRTSLCASCDPHGPRARRGSHAACWSHEHATTCARRSWRAAVASAVPGGRAAAVRAVLRQRGRSRAPRVSPGMGDRAGSRWPDPPTGSPPPRARLPSRSTGRRPERTCLCGPRGRGRRRLRVPLRSRRTAHVVCASCDRHGPRARRGSHAACWSREHAAATRTCDGRSEP
jgi:hypothetical protein